MKKMLLVVGLSIFGLLLVLGGCTPKKTVNPTPGAELNQTAPGTEGNVPGAGGSVDESNIPPEGSARGKNFGDVMSVNLADVRFEYDKYTLNNEAKAILAKNVDTLKSNPKVIVQIEGHADERGTVEYNLALGQKRATSVRNYLIAAGIDSGRVFTISYGKEKPLDPGHNEAAWEKNRRAHPAVAAQ
jgi:peptidoglycan-associated lipoprotein